MADISRRSFLKGSVAGALSLAATSLLGSGAAFADDAEPAVESIVETAS